MARSFMTAAACENRRLVLRVTLVVACLVSAANCGAQPDLPPVQFDGIKVADCPSGRASVPDHLIDGHSETARGAGEEIARFAVASGLGPLWCGEAGEVTYRATWLPWTRPVRVANLRKVGDRWEATTVEFADPRRRTPGTLGRDATAVKRRESISIEGATMEAFTKRFEIGQSLWNVADWDDSSDMDDGPAWVLELRRGATYKLIVRNGKFDPLVDEAMRALFDAAGAPIPDEKPIPSP